MDSETINAPAIKRHSVIDRGFRFGIEEEFFLVDTDTGYVATETPTTLFTLANMAARVPTTARAVPRSTASHRR